MEFMTYGGPGAAVHPAPLFMSNCVEIQGQRLGVCVDI